MKYRTFTIRIPEEIARILDAEARRRYYKNHGRTQLMTEILLERYRDEMEQVKKKPRRRSRTAKILPARELATGFPEASQG
jgi:hypothetical protein